MTVQEIIERAQPGGEGARFTPGRVLNLTDEGEVVEADDARSRYRLCSEDGSITQSLADDLGITSDPVDNNVPKSRRTKKSDAPADAPAPSETGSGLSINLGPDASNA